MKLQHGLTLKQKLALAKRPLVMGIVNATPDSFSDGGKHHTPEKAVAHAKQLMLEGADIIDIGGESTRPNAKPVDAQEEASRVIPVIEALREQSTALISIDTSKASVAQAALKAGAHIVNDVTALRGDPEMVRVCSEAHCDVILMHMQGTPTTMQQNPQYQDVVLEIRSFLKERCNFAIQKGISSESLVIDPGIGFGKTLSDNLKIIHALSDFTTLGFPLLIGLSRKRWIGELTEQPKAHKRLGGSLAGALVAVQRGAQIVRVHDVKETVDALTIYKAVTDDKYVD